MIAIPDSFQRSRTYRQLLLATIPMVSGCHSVPLARRAPCERARIFGRVRLSPKQNDECAGASAANPNLPVSFFGTFAQPSHFFCEIHFIALLLCGLSL